jgi:hypothetical protein
MVSLTLLILGKCPAADDPAWRVEVAKSGKAATALVEQPGNRSYGSAFCVHSSGIFLTNAHVVKSLAGIDPSLRITLVLNPGQKTEVIYSAKVIRSDNELDLALLQVNGVKDIPTLSLGSDEKLGELMEVVACGFPFGTAVAPVQNEYPAVSVNAGSITSLRYKNDRLHRIQTDVVLNPGNSGGPILDKSGKVIGVVVAGIKGSGVNFAIPVSTVADFVSRPEVQFEPPTINAANFFKPTSFEARVTTILPSKDQLTVELILKSARGGMDRTFRMEPAEGMYRATPIPLPRPPGPLSLQMSARFENGSLNATLTDRAFKVGEKEVRLSEIRKCNFQSGSGVVLLSGTQIEGKISGVDAVPVRLGEQTVAVDLSKAIEATFTPAAETNMLWYTLSVRQGEKEILRRCESMVISGLMRAPPLSTGLPDIRPPVLDADKVELKLEAPVADLAVGGGGRYLVLSLPKTHKLAIFDVNAAKVVGQVPLSEEGALFTAGLEDIIVVLPQAGIIERWSLTTLKRDIAATMPIKGVIKAIAMGSASHGPLLVLSAEGREPLDRASYFVVNTETLKPIGNEILDRSGHITNHRDLMHLRASADGRVFGLWCTSHSPNGLGLIFFSEGGAQLYPYAGAELNSVGTDFGYVVPNSDGTIVYTETGKYAIPIQKPYSPKPTISNPMLPAHGSNHFIRLPAVPFNFKLTDQVIVALKTEQVPDSILERLNTLKNRECNRELFLGLVKQQFNTAQIKKQFNAEQIDQFVILILKHAFVGNQNSTTTTIEAPWKDKPIATLPDLSLPIWVLERWIAHDFTYDKRVHFIPEARLIITIPNSNDRLILHRLPSTENPVLKEPGK